MIFSILLTLFVQFITSQNVSLNICNVDQNTTHTYTATIFCSYSLCSSPPLVSSPLSYKQCYTTPALFINGNSVGVSLNITGQNQIIYSTYQTWTKISNNSHQNTAFIWIDRSLTPSQLRVDVPTTNGNANIDLTGATLPNYQVQFYWTYYYDVGIYNQTSSSGIHFEGVINGAYQYHTGNSFVIPANNGQSSTVSAQISSTSKTIATVNRDKNKASMTSVYNILVGLGGSSYGAEFVQVQFGANGNQTSSAGFQRPSVILLVLIICLSLF